MQFYPNNIPISTIASAVSASFALTSSLINNFAAISVTIVDTASVGLNLTGSAGLAGSNSGGPIPGPKGAQGFRGVTGPRGNSVYLLSSSLYSGSQCSAPPANCFDVNLYTAFAAVEEATFFCDFSQGQFNPTEYYTTLGDSQEFVDAHFNTGSPLYTNDTCTDPVASEGILGAHLETGGNRVYGVNSLSTSSLAGDCQSSILV